MKSAICRHRGIKSNVAQLRQSKNGGSPSSGARQKSGTSNQPDANLKTGKRKSEQVREIDPEVNAGGAIKCGNIQSNFGSSSPKKRTENSWGLPTKDSK
jgi:hypothetical protein